jgi:hydrogenase expression/formation protein HypE
LSSTRKGFAVGKLPPEILSRTVYTHLGRKDKSVLQGPGLGRDSAAVKYKNSILIFTADPVTGTPSRIGQHSVEINANDIATAGARPRWYLCTILLPVGAEEKSLKKITTEIHETARRLGVSVVGGHTEATRRLNQPIISGFMIGETHGRILTAGNGKAGDRIFLTKTAGLEGTAILARDKATLLKNRRIPERLLRTARSFQELISVVEEALLAAKLPEVHAMHDPTEGGVLNGLWEIAEASNLGVEVWADRIPVAPATKVICGSLRLDPLKLMSSGALLLAVEASKASRVRESMSRIPGKLTEIGKLTSRGEGRWLLNFGKRERLKAVSQDELYQIV